MLQDTLNDHDLNKLHQQTGAAPNREWIHIPPWNHGNLGKSSSQKCRLKKGAMLVDMFLSRGLLQEFFFAMNEKHLAQKTCYDLR